MTAPGSGIIHPERLSFAKEQRRISVFYIYVCPGQRRRGMVKAVAETSKAAGYCRLWPCCAGLLTAAAALQVDQVHELEIVTPDGQQLTCSPTRHAEVFSRVLAGHGRSGTIVRARLPSFRRRSTPAFATCRIRRWALC